MAFSDAVGLLFKIKADSSDAKKDLSDLRRTVDKEIDAVENKTASGTDAASKSTAGFSSRLSGLATQATVAAAAIVGVAGVATGLAAAFLGLAKNAADAGVEIQRFSTLTGFSVEGVSALKAAAEQAGTSIDEIEEVFESFSELMIEAGKGAEDATEKVKKLGLDPQTAFRDLEGSFFKIIDAINAARSPAEKAAIAMNGMGESGLNMIKVAAEMEGGSAKYIARLKEMGLTIDREGVQRAKEFDREYKILGATIAGLTNQIARDFMPTLTQNLRELTLFLRNNRESIRAWGDVMGDTLNFVADTARSTYAALMTVAALRLGNPQLAWNVVQEYGRQTDERSARRQANRDKRDVPVEDAGNAVDYYSGRNTLNPDPSFVGEEARKKAIEEAKKRAEEEKKLAEERYQEQLKAQAEFQEQADELQETATNRLRTRIESESELKIAGHRVDLANLELALAQEELTLAEYANRKGQKERDILLERKFALQDELKLIKGNVDEEARLRQAIALIDKEVQQNRIATGQAVFEANKKMAEEETKLASERREKEREAHEERLRQEDERIERIRARYEYENEQRRLQAEEEERRREEETFEGGFLGAIGFEEAEEGVNIFGQALSQLGNIAGNVFKQLADGFGSMVQNWVLLGKESGASMKKLVATVLAGVAAQSAVLAIFELAKGFAALFFNPAEAAAHFKAAALFGALALGAGIAGRAVAGNSFQSASTQGAAQNGSNQRTTRQEDENRVIELNRNQPARVDVNVNLRTRSEYIVDTVRQDVGNNGVLRDLIIQTSEQ